jgi:hypothetical protein
MTDTRHDLAELHTAAKRALSDMANAAGEREMATAQLKARDLVTRLAQVLVTLKSTDMTPVEKTIAIHWFTTGADALRAHSTQLGSAWNV